MANDNISQGTPQHTPGAGLYFDATGRTHCGMTQLQALEQRNRNLQRLLITALERPCPSCGRRAGEEVAR